MKYEVHISYEAVVDSIDAVPGIVAALPADVRGFARRSVSVFSVADSVSGANTEAPAPVEQPVAEPAPAPAPAPSPAPAAAPAPTPSLDAALTDEALRTLCQSKFANAANKAKVREYMKSIGGTDTLSAIPADKREEFRAAVNELTV